MVIIIIVIILASILVMRRRRKKAEKDVASKTPEEATIWRDMYGRKFKEYIYETNQIICHNCLSKVDVQIPIRPLVVTCPKCNSRGVLYK